MANPEILPTNNRFKEDQDADSQADYLFDSSGNLAKNAQGREFTYNAENLQTTATGSGLSMSYGYDGNNKRVKTFDAVTDKTTIFVYGASGVLAGEYTINVPPAVNPTISYQITSNPFRAATATAAGNEPTMGWTRSLSVNTGRHAEVETFTGAALPAPWGSNTASTGVVTTDIDATRTLVTDQAGKQRISRTNALGQLTDIWEITAQDSATVSVTFPGTSIGFGYQTSYGYDTLNNLTTVSQGAQTRTFTYSSLSRLLSAANPESGTIAYKYDNNSNLIEKTDARGIVTSYTYDQLNRVTDRGYTNEPSGSDTPDVEYTYGMTAPVIGKLIKVDSAVSTTEYTGFDILGRVTASKQTTVGGAIEGYTSGYLYNLSGALIEQQYPSGRKVQNTIDQNGDLEMVRSRKNASSGYWAYANNFTYNAAGAATSMQLGNGRWESTTFNSRLQPTQIALGVTAGATNLLDLDYTYGTTANNGNVLTQTINVPTVGATAGFISVQSYNYDSLNRLKDATENITPNGGSQTQSWKQTFLFDRYGNRNFDEANTTFAGFDKLCNSNTELCADLRKKLNPSINASDNRLSSGQGYSFDSSGNTTRDAGDRKFTYDAENKQVKVESLSPGTDTVTGTIGEYVYDGDGKRVKKYVPSTGETTVFVYDAGGKLIAEYSTIVASSNDAKVAYLTNDHLGSPRINTDANGAVTARHDYHPFGEEIETSQRATGIGYAGDTVRKQFTGYERDNESELDFAKNRYHSFNLGRFTSPDPYKIVAEIEFEETEEKARAKLNRYLSVPQQWNRYSYTINNPLKYTDPTGELIYLPGSDEDVKKAHERLKNLLGAERYNLIKQSSDGRILYLNDGDICGSNCSKFANIGDTPLNKEFSKKFAAILSSPEKVRFGIALDVAYFKVDQKGNKTQALRDVRKESGGGLTVPANESISGDIEIWVAPDAASTANRLAPFGKPHLTEDGSRLNFPDNSVVDGHEFGHGYDELFGQTGNSIRFENAVRGRFPGQQRRKSEK